MRITPLTDDIVKFWKCTLTGSTLIVMLSVNDNDFLTEPLVAK